MTIWWPRLTIPITNVVISPETQKLLEERMRAGDYSSHDEVIRVALESLGGETLEDFDAETQSAIERANVQADQGEGILVDKAFSRLRLKHFRV